jgi:hypothetical protein
MTTDQFFRPGYPIAEPFFLTMRPRLDVDGIMAREALRNVGAALALPALIEGVCQDWRACG